MSDISDQVRYVDRLGPVLAGAAILVQAPRLVLTFLAADRLAVGPDTEQILLSVAAIGTAVVLTGGGVYIASAALTAPRWRLALGVAWALVLTASAGLVAPAIAGRLADQDLHEVVSAPGLRRAWAVLAALAHELTAAGCMLAAAAASHREGSEDLELRLYSERDAAVERAEQAERELSALRATLGAAPSELASNPQPFACERCGRSFRTKQARSGHQRTCPTPPASAHPTQQQEWS